MQILLLFMWKSVEIWYFVTFSFFSLLHRLLEHISVPSNWAHCKKVKGSSGKASEGQSIMLEMETTEGMIGSSSAQEEKPHRKLDFFPDFNCSDFFFLWVVPSIGKHSACKHANYNFVRFNDGIVMQVISYPRPCWVFFWKQSVCLVKEL